MSDPFIGEVKAVAFQFAPVYWSFCYGQNVDLQQNQALYSLLGNFYGGDNRTYFTLPDLRGRTIVGQGSGPGLSTKNIGMYGGRETAILTNANLPNHNHAIIAKNEIADTTDPTNALIASSSYMNGRTPVPVNSYSTDSENLNTLVPLENVACQSTGGGQAFSINQPYLTLNYIIAMNGVYPQRQ